MSAFQNLRVDPGEDESHRGPNRAAKQCLPTEGTILNASEYLRRFGNDKPTGLPINLPANWKSEWNDLCRSLRGADIPHFIVGEQDRSLAPKSTRSENEAISNLPVLLASGSSSNASQIVGFMPSLPTGNDPSATRVYARLFCNSMIPGLEFEFQLKNSEGKTWKTITATVFSRDLVIYEDNTTSFYFSLDKNVIQAAQQKIPDSQYLSDLIDRQQVGLFHFVLDSQAARIHGISVSELSDYAETHSWAGIIVSLWKGDSFDMFFRIDSSKDRKARQAPENITYMFDHFCSLLDITCQLGYFWWYRLWHSEDLLSDEFPWKDIPIPPWLIRSWIEVEPDTTPSPHDWATINAPKIFPNDECIAIWSSIASARTQATRMIAINTLMAASQDLKYDANFRQTKYANFYAVAINFMLGEGSDSAKLQFLQPDEGTHIEIKLNFGGKDYIYHGEVTPNSLGLKFNVLSMVWGQPWPGLAQSRFADAVVSLQFTTDPVSPERESVSGVRLC